MIEFITSVWQYLKRRQADVGLVEHTATEPYNQGQKWNIEDKCSIVSALSNE